VSNDGADVRMSDGRLFHARGPATANARSPVRELQCAGQKGVNSLTAALRISTNSNCELQTIQIQKKLLNGYKFTKINFTQ